MDSDPNQIKENLSQIGTKAAKILLKEWIDNSNNLGFRKNALRIYSSIDDGKNFKFYEHLYLSDEEIEIRTLSGEILNEKYYAHKKIISLFEFALNHAKNMTQKFQALESLNSIDTKKTRKAIKDYLKKTVKSDFKEKIQDFPNEIINPDYNVPISNSVLEICYNLILHDYYVYKCGYNATLRNGLIILLNCEGAGITNISDIQGYKKLKKLEHFLLQRNKIPKISGLSHLLNLKILNLSHNNIEKMENLEVLKNLEELFLTGNKVRKMENLKLTSLKKLYLDRNLISEIGDLEGLSNLETLNLNQNNISELKGLETLKKLKNLYLSYNKVTSINGIQNLGNLISLYLNNNNIIRIQGLEGLLNLKVLSLSNNNIKNIENLNQLENLLKLELSQNQIEKFQGLDKLSKLQELYIDKNQLQKIEGLNGLKSLIILFLEGNKITDFKLKYIEHLKNLNFIFLNDNPLTPESRENYLKRTRFP